MDEQISGRDRAVMEGELALFEGLERIRQITVEIDQAIILTRLGSALDPSSVRDSLHSELRSLLLASLTNVETIAGQLLTVARVLCHPEQFD